MIQNICTYRIEVQGQVDESAFNAKSPVRIAVVRAEMTATRFTIFVDQSGLIGLVRHLHGQGFVLLSVCRDPEETSFTRREPSDA